MEEEKIYITKGDAVLALLEKGQHSKRYKLGESWELNLFEIQEAIDAMPAADVQPVKHGRWIWDSNAPHREHGAYKCSNCGCHSDFEENYCYNCGARMIKDGDEE